MHDLTEPEAIDRVVDQLREGGREVDAVLVARCRPKRRGRDTHVEDIGKALKSGSLDIMPPTEGDDLDAWCEEVMGRLLAHEEAFSRLRLRIGGPVIAAFFRKIIPNLPAQEWSWRRSSVQLPPDGGWQAAKPQAACRSGEKPLRGTPPPGTEEFVIFDGPEGLLVRDESGSPLPVVKGAVRLFDADGAVVRVLANTTVRAVENAPVAPERWRHCPSQKARRPRLRVLQWQLGPANWEQAFRNFVTHASLYGRGAINELTGAGLAKLFGETRAAVSARRRTEFLNYQHRTGGRSAFAGLRGTVDPRRGKKRKTGS